jgi:hypothetical protein
MAGSLLLLQIIEPVSSRKCGKIISHEYERAFRYNFFASGVLYIVTPHILALKAWWLNGSAPDCCPAVQGTNPASPQPTADRQSSGGLPPGIALGCELTSVRGNRGENHEKNTYFGLSR